VNCFIRAKRITDDYFRELEKLYGREICDVVPDKGGLFYTNEFGVATKSDSFFEDDSKCFDIILADKGKYI